MKAQASYRRIGMARAKPARKATFRYATTPSAGLKKAS